MSSSDPAVDYRIDYPLKYVTQKPGGVNLKLNEPDRLQKLVLAALGNTAKEKNSALSPKLVHMHRNMTKTEEKVVDHPDVAAGKELTLPYPTKGFGKTGHIFLRRSSMFSKSWREAYWLHLFPATLLVFRSAEDLETWKFLHSDEESGYNGGRNDKLIKFGVNFDVNGVVNRQIQKLNKKLCKQGKMSKKEYKAKRPSVLETDTKNKNDLRVIKYDLEEVYSKEYKNKIIHTCKIHRWSEIGVAVAIMFGSHNPQELKNLRQVVRHCLKISVKQKKTKSEKESVSHQQTLAQRLAMDREDNVSVTSGVSSSNMSGLTYRTKADTSIISGVSTTIYDVGRVRHRHR
jgi:hypothetical protein